MDVTTLLTEATRMGATDIFIVAGLPLSYKINGMIQEKKREKLFPPQTEEIIRGIYELADHRNFPEFSEKGDDDFSFSIKGISRFRVNAYKQRGSLAAVVRVIAFYLPKPKDLGIPDTVINLANYHKGMILVTGPAGGGKSTTMACMIDHINSERRSHIITLEDPLEHLHTHKKSIVSQREICTDTQNYVTALRSALRQSPDVVLLGEMRDYETINIAMTAAETGHLVLSTLHTIGAANTIDRVIDLFPPNQKHQIAIQLSMVLNAVVSQQLIPSIEGRQIPVFEIMIVTPAIRNMIRDGKVHQIHGMIYASSGDYTISMDSSLLRLFKEGRITEKTALHYATDPEMLANKLK